MFVVRERSCLKPALVGCILFYEKIYPDYSYTADIYITQSTKTKKYSVYHMLDTIIIAIVEEEIRGATCWTIQL